MIYPNLEQIHAICDKCGGNPPDAISEAKVFDIIRWNTETGELWATPTIASDIDNRRNYSYDVRQLAIVGRTHITTEELIERIGAITCPHIETGDGCPLTQNRNCYALMDRLWRSGPDTCCPCEHTQEVRRIICRGALGV